jgi:transcriptional regulator with XRE-family HTH domain
MIKRIGPSKPFRHYIVEWMEKLDVNQERLAGRLECEPSTVSKLLTGRQRLSDVWLAGIADALDLEIAQLFIDPNRPTPEELLAGLTEDQRTTVLNLIDLFKRSA